MAMHPEEVDLVWLSHVISARVAPEELSEFLEGKTAIRDGVADELACSLTVAEQVVETMILRGMIRYRGDPQRAGSHGSWLLRAAYVDDDN